MKTTRRIIGGLGLALWAGGCAVGPNYQKPEAPAIASFSEDGMWKPIEPKDSLPKGNWWVIFHDASLDALEQTAVAASQNVQAAVARRDQARAVARVSLGDFFPLVNFDPSGSRARYSANRQTQIPATREAYTTNSFNIPLDLSYELDIWGRVRRNIESLEDLAAASDAAYQTILLGVESDVAQTYFTLRSLAVEKALVARSIETRRQAVDLVQKRYTGGASAELDLFRAQAELATAENDALILDQRRAALRHSLAVLCGQTPENFAANEQLPWADTPPNIPIGLPSEVLERRPDVAAAERTLAAVNAQIGIAKAAFFPSIRLIGSAGFNSTDLDSLFDWSSRQWAIGPSITLPVFDGGRNRANYERAKFAYNEAIANYRQRLLVSFQEVEDSLSNLHSLEDQSGVIARAVTASRKAADLSTIRYKAGLVSFLEVVDAERTALQNERVAAQVNGQRFLARTQLVRALGGGG